MSLREARRLEQLLKRQKGGNASPRFRFYLLRKGHAFGVVLNAVPARHSQRYYHELYQTRDTPGSNGGSHSVPALPPAALATSPSATPLGNETSSASPTAVVEPDQRPSVPEIYRIQPGKKRRTKPRRWWFR